MRSYRPRRGEYKNDLWGEFWLLPVSLAIEEKNYAAARIEE
jgi:hypothetical protein